MPGSRSEASAALIEVTRVLVEDRGENGCTEHAAYKDVGVVGAVTLAVTFGSLAVVGVGVAGLLDAGEEAGGKEGDGIGGGTKGEAEFLFWVERGGVPDEAGVEVRKDSEDALMDLGGDLLVGDLLLGDDDLNGYVGGGDRKSDDRELAVFSGAERDFEGFVGLEVGCGDLDLEGSGGQVVEREEAGGVGGLSSVRHAILTLKSDSGAGYDASIDVGDVSADGGGGLAVRRLRGGREAGGIGPVRLVGYKIGWFLCTSGRGDAKEEDAEDESVEDSWRGAASVVPIAILHLESRFRIGLSGIDPLAWPGLRTVFPRVRILSRCDV